MRALAGAVTGIWVWRNRVEVVVELVAMVLTAAPATSWAAARTRPRRSLEREEPVVVRLSRRLDVPENLAEAAVDSAAALQPEEPLAYLFTEPGVVVERAAVRPGTSALLRLLAVEPMSQTLELQVEGAEHLERPARVARRAALALQEIRLKVAKAAVLAVLTRTRPLRPVPEESEDCAGVVEVAAEREQTSVRLAEQEVQAARIFGRGKEGLK